METAYELIRKKRDHEALTTDELRQLIDSYMGGQIADYQMSAFLMSVFFSGMSDTEISSLTDVMLHSGVTVDLSEIPGSKVDKHSTGGVGDKTSMILAPIVACAGITVPMISGHGLGHTGGTLDKLAAIPGFTTQCDLEKFKEILKTHGLSFIGQTSEICPADKKLYALRDVTATVDSLPLICASIMSKKLAEGIDGLVLDVKWGNGAFLKSLPEAKDLADHLLEIGRHHGLNTTAVISNMNQPLGRLIGNGLEMEEVLAILKSEGCYGFGLHDFQDTIDLSLELAGAMIWLGGKAPNTDAGITIAKEILESGAAFEKFKEVALAHGGDIEGIVKAKSSLDVIAEDSGFITAMDTEEIGMKLIHLKAGRTRKGDAIDPTAGLMLQKKIGDYVEKGESIGRIFATDEEEKLSGLAGDIRGIIKISPTRREPEPLVAKRYYKGKGDQ